MSASRRYGSNTHREDSARDGHGEMTGHLIRAPRGTNGFGYDPIFVADGSSLTSAELSDEAKDAISHRGRALRALAPHLAAAVGG